MLTTPGVVLLLDVPRVPDPVRVFDQMRMVAKRMTQTLEGVLVDDNRRPLNDASLAAIRAQVQTTATALSEAHIDPGGPRAVRLFG
jgi:FtsZ-interacting cell division protein ZipA